MAPVRSIIDLMKLCIVRADHLGDLMLTTPLVRALAKGGYKVEVVTHGEYLPVFNDNPHVTASHALETVYPSFPGRWRDFSKWLRAGGYDVIVLPYARPMELLLASLFSGIQTRIAMWSGLWGRLTFHRCLRSHLVDQPRHFTDILLDCGRTLGVQPDGYKLDLFLPTALLEWAGEERMRIGDARHLVGIHPGCGGNACNLPASVYGRLAQLLLKHEDAHVVVTGGGHETSLVAGWPDDVLKSTRFWNTMGQLSILQLAALIGQMSSYVVPSTGPLHLASCMGTTTISPFCAYPPLSPTVWGNTGGSGLTVMPPKEHCRLHRSHEHGQCDFARTISGDDLYLRVAESMGWQLREQVSPADTTPSSRSAKTRNP
jgi:ADP-heptose:LPS heptosyltransferase